MIKTIITHTFNLFAFMLNVLNAIWSNIDIVFAILVSITAIVCSVLNARSRRREELHKAAVSAAEQEAAKAEKEYYKMLIEQNKS